ncbi:MAG: hypothetical protein E6J20_19225 [Chloroflexi bacterium]|nr:MAG: hypothetical protein E6J20_19225 [Chloroflexota bacterium]
MVLRLPDPDPAEGCGEPPPPRHGSAAPGAGEELLSAAVELPWDDYLGAGAADRVRDGSLGLVRHAYPATAARDMRGAATPGGQLHGDAAARERLGAIALGVAAAHHRPARMPHGPGEEPFAWWVAEERSLVWMPWSDASVAAYGLELLDTGQAEAVVVAAPDACWTVFRTGLPRSGAGGGWADLPDRFRDAVAARSGAPGDALATARWRREADTITVSWRQDGRVRHARLAVNRPDTAPHRGLRTR